MLLVYDKDTLEVLSAGGVVNPTEAELEGMYFVEELPSNMVGVKIVDKTLIEKTLNLGSDRYVMKVVLDSQLQVIDVEVISEKQPPQIENEYSELEILQQRVKELQEIVDVMLGVTE